MSKPYQDQYYKSKDGLNLYARDYQNPNAKLTLLCLHGFARNSADFEDVAEILQKDYRVIVADQRGRGKSEYDSDPLNYNPITYTSDMFLLLESLGVENVVVIGTSMGGVIAMTMASMRTELVKAIILNDLGPSLDPIGLQEIVQFFASIADVHNWDEALSYCKSVAGKTFPNFTQKDWETYVKKGFAEDENGKVVRLYDLAISDLYKGYDAHETPMDLWPVFNGSRSAKFMIIRGGISKLLNREAFDDLERFDNVLSRIEVPDVGHAPMLNEDIAVKGIQEFLEKIQND